MRIKILCSQYPSNWACLAGLFFLLTLNYLAQLAAKAIPTRSTNLSTNSIDQLLAIARVSVLVKHAASVPIVTTSVIRIGVLNQLIRIYANII